MNFSKRSTEGYVLIDHRNSPGISEEFVHKNKLNVPAVGAGMTFESAVAICHGCGADIILNPNRTREREYCALHDAYLCDMCALRRKLNGRCVPLRQKFDNWYNALIRRMTR